MIKRIVFLLVAIQIVFCTNNTMKVYGQTETKNNKDIDIKKRNINTFKSEQKVAFLVAVDTYKKINQNTEQLNVKKDVEIIEKELRNNSYKINTMIASKGDQPTSKKILEQIEKIGKDTNKIGLFLFYFTGHGQKKYLITYDYDENFDYRTNSLSTNDLMERIEKYINAENILVMIDACHSGSAHQIKGEIVNKNQKEYTFDVSFFPKINNKDISVNDSFQKKNIHVLTSSSENQLSHAVEGCSYFAKSFVDAVKGKADGCSRKQKNSKNNFIDLCEVDCFVKEDVQRMIDRDSANYFSLIDFKTGKPYKQTPKITSIGNQSEVIISSSNKRYSFVKNIKNNLDCNNYDDIFEFYKKARFNIKQLEEKALIDRFKKNINFQKFIISKGLLKEFWIFSGNDTYRSIRFSRMYDGKDSYNFQCNSIDDEFCYVILKRPKNQCNNCLYFE